MIGRGSDFSHIDSNQATAVHQAQVKELKQEIADLYLQVQILKKILNKSLLVKKSNGSVITTDNLGQLQRDVE